MVICGIKTEDRVGFAWVSSRGWWFGYGGDHGMGRERPRVTDGERERREEGEGLSTSRGGSLAPTTITTNILCIHTHIYAYIEREP